MSESNPIRVFVTHAFTEDEDYLRVFEFLESNERFFYVNVSQPENIPSGGFEEIKDELIRQIKEAETVFVTTQSYLSKPDLVRFQMQAALAQGTPLLGIAPFGGVVPLPDEIEGKAMEILDWNERDFADALRRHARLQDTSRWDVIDFP